MKKTTLMLATALAASFAAAEGGINEFNDLGYGTLSGKLQSLSMYRDYDNGNNNYSSTLSIQLDYLSPTTNGWTAGFSYIGVGVVDAMDLDNPPAGLGPGEALLGNGRVNLLNEAFLDYNLEDFALTNTTVWAGRKVNNAEVFRANAVRSKARSIQALAIESKDLPQTRVTVGHADRMSNWIQSGDQWNFRDFGDVFGVGYDTDGVTWGEAVNTSYENIELAAFDAIAWDVCNLLGFRGRFGLSEDITLLGYYRNETDIGQAADRDSNVLGISIETKVNALTLEGGYFGVYGDDLRFQETTTGINHTLGDSMMIFARHYEGGANTLYAKAVTKLEKTATTLYGLYNYTRHDTGKAGKSLRSGHELNFIAKQPIPKFDNLTVALKLGFGYRDGYNGAPDIFGTDTRLFVTYGF